MPWRTKSKIRKSKSETNPKFEGEIAKRVSIFLPSRFGFVSDFGFRISDFRFGWFAALMLLAVGCNRQDTECLTRIGRKLAAHAKAGTGEIGTKIDLSWAGKREPNLQDKIYDRLRFENTLTDVTFEVRVNGKEIELKGSVKTALQRQRAIELAETVAGVEKVNADILVRDAE